MVPLSLCTDLCEQRTVKESPRRGGEVFSQDTTLKWADPTVWVEADPVTRVL